MDIDTKIYRSTSGFHCLHHMRFGVLHLGFYLLDPPGALAWSQPSTRPLSYPNWSSPYIVHNSIRLLVHYISSTGIGSTFRGATQDPFERQQGPLSEIYKPGLPLSSSFASSFFSSDAGFSLTTYKTNRAVCAGDRPGSQMFVLLLVPFASAWQQMMLNFYFLTSLQKHTTATDAMQHSMPTRMKSHSSSRMCF